MMDRTAIVVDKTDKMMDRTAIVVDKTDKMKVEQLKSWIEPT
ncbi:hypothetical protein [Lysinibacillus sp. NPDC086135]